MTVGVVDEVTVGIALAISPCYLSQASRHVRMHAHTSKTYVERKVTYEGQHSAADVAVPSVKLVNRFSCGTPVSNLVTVSQPPGHTAGL